MRHARRWILTIVMAVVAGNFCTTLQAGEIWGHIRAIFTDGDERQQARIAEQDAQQARIEAARNERQAYHEACRHRHEQVERANIDQSLKAKVGIGLTQRIRLGQPEVDMEKMKTLMAQLEKDNEVMQRMYAQIDQQRNEEYVQKLKAHLQARVEAEEKGCECKVPCPQPPLPARLPPVEKALLPTQIPIKLNATLEVGFEEAEMEEARIQRLPAKMPCEKKPCERCQQGKCQHGNCPDGQCPIHGHRSTQYGAGSSWSETAQLENNEDEGYSLFSPASSAKRTGYRGGIYRPQKKAPLNNAW